MDAITQESQEERIVAWCAAYIGNVLNIDPATIRANDELDGYGLDSSIMTSMIFDMEDWLKAEVPVSVLFAQSTLRGMASEVVKRLP